MSYSSIDINPLTQSKVAALLEEFSRLFPSDSHVIKVSRVIDSSPVLLRSLLWKVYLDVLPGDAEHRSSWTTILAEEREKYASLRAQYIFDPSKEDLDPTFNNPLSTHQESPWNKYYQTSDLQKTIRNDIERTYPEKEFFQLESTQDLLVHILFVWAQLNPTVEYRQGMNELLAPIVYVLHEEALSKSTNLENPPSDINILCDLLDDRYLEHDSFLMFCKIMAAMYPLYAPNAVSTSKKNIPDAAAPSSVAVRGTNIGQSTVVRRCRCLHTLLKRVDPQLYRRIIDMGIEPQLYALRWLRLLLSREFHLADILILWDSIFCEGGTAVDPEDGSDGLGNFGLLDHLCVSMLIYVREQVLESNDESFVLRRLMRYPPVEDVRVLIDRAVLMKDAWEKTPIEDLKRKIPVAKSPLFRGRSDSDSVVPFARLESTSRHREALDRRSNISSSSYASVPTTSPTLSVSNKTPITNDCFEPIHLPSTISLFGEGAPGGSGDFDPEKEWIYKLRCRDQWLADQLRLISETLRGHYYSDMSSGECVMSAMGHLRRLQDALLVGEVDEEAFPPVSAGFDQLTNGR